MWASDWVIWRVWWIVVGGRGVGPVVAIVVGGNFGVLVIKWEGEACGRL